MLVLKAEPTARKTSHFLLAMSSSGMCYGIANRCNAKLSVHLFPLYKEDCSLGALAAVSADESHMKS